jgi:hypothetical protein
MNEDERDPLKRAACRQAAELRGLETTEPPGGVRPTVRRDVFSRHRLSHAFTFPL